jgi:hypothetical protein
VTILAVRGARDGLASAGMPDVFATAEIDRGRHDPVTPWDDPRWRAETLSWVEAGLAAHSLRAGSKGWRVRLRPWSVIFRIPLMESADVVWFKANPPGSRFEAGLLQALSAWRPADVLTPLAVDADRGWSLQPDGGRLFADFLDHDPAASIRDWESAVRQYAVFQHSVVPHTATIAATGVPLCPPDQAVDILDRLIDGSAGLSAEHRAGLKDLLPAFADWCAELAAVGIPDTLDHSDLHASQILGPTPDGGYRFFDWGDAVIGHPFGSLRVILRVVRDRFGAEADVTRLRDAYLEPWATRGTSLSGLRRAVTLACRTAAITRALAWGRLFEGHLGGPGRSLDTEVADSLAALLSDEDEV